jgi:hypothetical protein
MNFKSAPSRVARWHIFKPDLGKFWRVSQWKMLEYVMDIWSILWPFGIFCGLWVYFIVIWFFPFWHVVPRKIWQPCAPPQISEPNKRVQCSNMALISLSTIWVSYLNVFHTIILRHGVDFMKPFWPKFTEKT